MIVYFSGTGNSRFAAEFLAKQLNDELLDAGHIPGAVLLSVGTITADTAAQVIPETDSVVLVYCRSGNRSKTASQTLAELGYTNVYEFGGINTWSYEVERP